MLPEWRKKAVPNIKRTVKVIKCQKRITVGYTPDFSGLIFKDKQTKTSEGNRPYSL